MLFTEYYWGNEIEEDEMGKDMKHAWKRREKSHKTLVGKGEKITR
jgi:hypothetical protein